MERYPFESEVGREEKLERPARARSGALYVRDVGQGEPIVLIHDFPLNGRMWEPQLEALSDRYRLVAPDLAGFGLSRAPTVQLTMADYARAVAGTLDQLRIDHVRVAGAGVGGYVALHLVEELGARLRGLLLMSASVEPDAPETARWRHPLAAETDAVGVETVADEFLPKMIGRSTQRERPDLLHHLRSMVRENTPNGVAVMLRAVAARRDPAGLLERIRCPVVCVVGAEDILTAPHRLAERIPGALMHTIPETGHLINLERPQIFNDVLMQFMAESTT